MVRNAPRRRVPVAVVLALVGLMAAPVDECDDYAFFQPGAVSAQAEVPADGPAGSEHQHVCSCLVCVLTTDDSFAPSLPAPQRGDAVETGPAVLCSSAYLPVVFHPPIA